MTDQTKTRDRHGLTTVFEITGSVLAMAYALLIASNTGAELVGFALLLLSSGLFAAWAVIDRRWTFLLLQGFYAASAIIGLIRWA
ncbi:hypothetical protein [Ruegeria sp. A3M17]|uniref:hypothetical protein n=1 Tax=Ruegeria sp. A3M17 TaxID=2267229 RepID=UPI000DEAAA06|nr:hypothetical protein [Ruegeria sp. A3M17]RBW61713.1 hypothetical protein DS906_03930 [Ruegeria sp. A3M17]